MRHQQSYVDFLTTINTTLSKSNKLQSAEIGKTKAENELNSNAVSSLQHLLRQHEIETEAIRDYCY